MDRTLLERASSAAVFPSSRSHHVDAERPFAERTASYIPNLNPLFDPVDSVSVECLQGNASRLLTGYSEDIGPELPQSLVPAGSIRSSIINLTTATLGVGTLAIPSAFANAGLVLSVGMLLIQAWLGFTSIKQLISSFNVLEKSGFEEVIMTLFGRRLAMIFEVSILFFCFGAAVAYHITIADIGIAISTKLLCDYSDNPFIAAVFLGRPGFLCLVTSCILLPLSLYKRIAELRFTCLIGVCCVIGLVLVVCVEFYSQGLHPSIRDDWTSILWPRGFRGVVSSLGIITFAFCSQPNVPTIFADLHSKSIRRMNMAVSRALALCVIVYLVIGTAGFLQWGPQTSSSVIVNLQPEFFQGKFLVLVGYLAMGVAVCMAFPLNIFPLKFTVEQLSVEMQVQNTELIVRIATIITVLLSLTCAIFVPNISVIFDVVGVTAGAFICFICPAGIFLRILSLGGGTFHRRAIKAWIVLSCGIAVMTVGTVTSLGLL